MNNRIKQKAIAVVLHRGTNYILIAFIFSCILSYIYFVNRTVRTATGLQKIKTEIQTLNIEVSELEAKRLVLDNSVNTNMAKHLGLIEVNHQTFIITKSEKVALSLK